MSFKVPTFHDSGEQGDVEESELGAIESKALKEQIIKSLSGWIFFWFVIAVIAYLITDRVNPNGNTLEIAGYVTISFAGLLIYTNALGGSQFMAGGGLVNHKIVMKDYRDSRIRVFTKWMGPSVGIVLGIILLAISTFQ